MISIASNDRVKQSLSSNWFQSGFWQEQSAIKGQSKGRHITWFVKPPIDISKKAWVLRHYYRGGMVSKITHDSFFYTGIKNTRPYRELTLLDWMYQADLPVPKPIAAQVVRKGLFYRADLLMEKLDAKDLVAVLIEKQLQDNIWQKIGKVIAKFHFKGIFHADLNAHNILIDKDEKTWLIDFDRCERRNSDTDWQQKNLQRLKRSLLKEKQLNSEFNFDEKDWSQLIDGYSANIKPK